jgi:hypothetical protein
MQIDFCAYMEIFLPHAVQFHPTEFPGGQCVSRVYLLILRIYLYESCMKASSLVSP